MEWTASLSCKGAAIVDDVIFFIVITTDMVLISWLRPPELPRQYSFLFFLLTLSPLPHTCPPMHVLCLTEIKIKCEKAKGCCSCFSSDIIVFTFILWTFMWSWHLQHSLCIFSLVADVKPSSLFLCLFVDAALFRSQFYRCLCSCLF